MSDASNIAYQRLFEMPRARVFSTFDMDSALGRPIMEACFESEFIFMNQLLDELESNKIEGDIVEFGVAGAIWLSKLADWRDRSGSARKMYGFDSFEGLPETTPEDLDCWSKGMYAYDLPTVSATLRAPTRPWLSLVEGWFSDSLATPVAQAIGKIAYVRVDCDLYSSTVDCLKFLTTRLHHGSILVFDDWTYDHTKGETRAFLEWLPQVPHFKFEPLLENPLGHIYMRVLER